MKRSRFSEEQIIGILNEHEAGVPVDELCRKHGMSPASLSAWKAKFGGMEVSDAKRLKALEAWSALREGHPVLFAPVASLAERLEVEVGNLEHGCFLRATLRLPKYQLPELIGFEAAIDGRIVAIERHAFSFEFLHECSYVSILLPPALLEEHSESPLLRAGILR